MPNKVGNRLSLFRKQQGVTMKTFAKQLGISQGALSGLESGKSKPATDTLIRLINETDINIEWLLTGKGTMRKQPQQPVSPSIQQISDWLNEISKNNDAFQTWFDIQFEISFPLYKAWLLKEKLSPPKS